MSSLFFWNSWAREYRYTWYALALLFLFSLAFMWFGYVKGPDSVIQWQHLQEQKVLDITVHSFRLGPFVLDVPAESYAILEYMQGSQIEPNVIGSYIYLAILFLALTLIISFVTVLDKIWFYVGSTLFIFFLFFLRLEVVGVFGFYSKIVGGVAIALYMIPAFCFNRFLPATPFLIRLFIFSGVTVVLGLLVGFFSEQDLPFYHLVLTSYTGTIILAIIFMIVVSHEIFASFVQIASQGTGKSLRHLLILTLIYGVNVVLTYARELQLISFEFIYINILLILTVSALLGIWGFRKREAAYGNLFPFDPFGGFLFLTLGSVCFITIGHHLINANDPIVHVLKHLILFSHLGYGLIFILYVLANFGQILWDNGPVYKVLYTPRRMPYFTFRLAGFVCTLAILIYAQWKIYLSDAISGFHNIAGDFYSLVGDSDYAYAFYLKASKEGFRNHRSHYALAMINAAQYDFEEAHTYIDAANARRPSDYSLTNAGNFFIRENLIPESIGEFHRSLQVAPALGPVNNNIAVSYIKQHNLDSALFFLAKARENQMTKNSAETNFFAMAALEKIPIDVDSIYKTFKNSSSGVLSNVYALSTITNRPLKVEADPLATTELSLYTATFLNNYTLKNAKTLDTTFTRKAWEIASDPRNAGFSEALKASLAYAYYHQGNVSKALEVLAEQVYLSQSYQGKFNYIMGLWALEQNNPELASSYFNFADTYAHKDAPFYNAIALSESRDVPGALSAWDSVEHRGTTAQKDIAINLKNILTIPVAQAFDLNDAAKYQFCRYRISLSDSLLFDKVNATFSNENYQVQALLDYSQRFFEAGLITPAIKYYQRVAGVKLTNEKLYNDVRYFELRLLAWRRELRGLATQINNGIEFTNERFLEKVYYTALLNEASGDTVNASRNYSILARYNPYFEDGVLAAYHYFKQQRPRGFEAYNILSDAIQINNNSLPLLKAYYNEALNVGLDEYAATTADRIREVEQRVLRK